VSRGEGELLTVPKPRAVSLLSVYLAVKPVGKPDAGIGSSGLMSGDGKRSVAEGPKLPRPSSTLPTGHRGQNRLPSTSANKFPDFVYLKTRLHRKPW
jgi:hypothetical protein